MAARAVEAAKAFVRVAWEDSAIRRGIASATGLMKSFAAGVAKVGFGNLLAQGINAATQAVFEFADAGAKIDDIANRTGASAEGLSQLAFAADQSGASIDDVEKAMRKLADVETEAARGGSTAAKALGRVGLTAKDLDGLTPEDKFLAISQGLSQIEDPAERSSLAMDLLGKSGANLLPMMEDGAEGIQKMMAEADSLGMTLTGDQAKAAADFDDTWQKTMGTLASVGKVIGAMVLPYVTSFLEVLMQAVPVVMQFGRDLGNAIVSGAQRAWQAISEFTTSFEPLLAAVKETFGAIGSALASGEYAAAAKVLWTSLKAAFLSGINGILTEWMAWKKAFLDVFNDAMTAVVKAWHKTQNYLSHGVVQVMAVFDSSINADQVGAELDAMLRQQLQAVDASAEQNQRARDAQFENDITTVNADLAAARDEWKQAVLAANQVAEQNVNDPAASAVAEDKFTKLIQDMKAGDIATRIEGAVGKSGGQIGDIRSVAGAGQLTALINRTGRIEQQMLSVLQVIERNTQGIGAPVPIVNI